jgi:phage tail sheath protein FI
MPTLAYPGVYVEEVPSGIRAITGVQTSVTAFIGTSAGGR